MKQHLSVYSFVEREDNYIGTDVIKVSLIYNETAFAPEGDPVILKEYPFDDGTAKHRPPLIQTFKGKASGDRVTPGMIQKVTVLVSQCWAWVCCCCLS